MKTSLDFRRFSSIRWSLPLLSEESRLTLIGISVLFLFVGSAFVGISRSLDAESLVLRGLGRDEPSLRQDCADARSISTS